MSAAEYHADKTRVSRSHLVDFLQSPWLYFKRYIRRDPKWQKEATDALDFGILFHAAVLEGVPITDMVHLIPESVLNDDGHRKAVLQGGRLRLAEDDGIFLAELNGSNGTA